ncbi:hypothetical protein [Desulfonatronovibrio magnus]|uniref:hypothetical protein n=1 Tax=Desulfonatronovibrio magnus TaxID=698827 RepID=UPI0005EAFDFD|nr:hypothetical protein [Desulfonatronovibrio magnus]
MLDKRLKIIFDFLNMSGGAPRSQLEHMMAMKQAGHNVIATIESDAELLRQKSKGVKVFEVDNFSTMTPIKNFYIIKKWTNIINAVKPDLIHANRKPQFRFLAVVSDLTGVPLVFVQPGGVTNIFSIKSMYRKTPVCYSLENKRSFIHAGFLPSEINVISNRIKAFHVSKFHSHTGFPVKILFTGNIKRGTVQGLCKFLEHIKEISGQIKVPFLLYIAGQDTSPGRIYHEIVATKIFETNRALSGKGNIENLGWVEDIEKLQASMDICIGKGRSVIQPAMAGKICFVIAETGRLTRVSNKTFQSLYEFNFSGRGDQEDCRSDFLALLSDYSCLAKLMEESDSVAPKVCDFYLAENAKEKLEYVYAQALKTQSKRPQRSNAIKRYIFLYMLSLQEFALNHVASPQVSQD